MVACSVRVYRVPKLEKQKKQEKWCPKMIEIDRNRQKSTQNAPKTEKVQPQNKEIETACRIWSHL
jgi:hypothetical protein